MIVTGSMKLLGAPSSDVNTLDYYEEGTWTPYITAATPGTLSVSYSSRSGTYTRIGRLVSVHAHINVDTLSIGTASGAVIIAGLPFEPLAGPSMWGICYTTGVSIGNNPAFCCVNKVFGKAFQLHSVNDNSGSSSIVISSVASSDSFQFSFCYNAE